jgi:hypothetical protein
MHNTGFSYKDRTSAAVPQRLQQLRSDAEIRQSERSEAEVAKGRKTGRRTVSNWPKGSAKVIDAQSPYRAKAKVPATEPSLFSY